MRGVFCKSYFEFAFNAVADGDGNIDGDGDWNGNGDEDQVGDIWLTAVGRLSLCKSNMFVYQIPIR